MRMLKGVAIQALFACQQAASLLTMPAKIEHSLLIKKLTSINEILLVSA